MGLWLGSSHGSITTLVITIMGSPQGTHGQGGRWAWRDNLLLSGVSQEVGQTLGNGGVSPRSSVRSKWTCFFIRPLGEHSVTDPGGEWGHPAECIRAL